MRKWSGVCVHHSSTLDSATKSWEAIYRHHIEINKWATIGYHFGVEDVDNVVGVRVGRSLNLSGAHCRPLNSSHIGLCIVGDFDKEKPSELHLEIASLLISDLAVSYQFPINEQSIMYHKDAWNTKCPGQFFPDKKEFIERINKHMKGRIAPKS